MRLLFCLSLLLFTLPAFSQRTHELKTDLLLPGLGYAHLAYEYSPKGRFSFEAGMFFNWTHALVIVPPEGYYYDPSDPRYGLIEWNFTSEYARQFIGIVQFSGRYYFSKKHPAAGFYGGLYLIKAFQIWRDKQYDALAEARYGEPVAVFKPKHFGIGLMTGYKWLLFKKRILLEPNIGIDFDPQRYDDPFPLADSRVYIIPTVKLGFRFP